MQKDETRYGKLQEVKQFEFSKQGRLPFISAMVDIRNMSTMRRKVLKMGSISTLKRCGNYGNSLSSVKSQLSVGWNPTRRANFIL